MVDRAVNKLVALEAEQTRAELARLRTRLQAYEQLYGMRSEDFYDRFRITSTCPMVALNPMRASGF